MKSKNMIKTGMALASLAAVWTSPLAIAGVTRDTQAISISLIDPCSLSMAGINLGTAWNTTVKIVEAKGKINFGIHIDTQGVIATNNNGTMPTGDDFDYLVSGNLNHNVVVPNGGPLSDLEVVMKVQLVRPDGDNNVKFDLPIRITVNADGTYTVTPLTPDNIECQ